MAGPIITLIFSGDADRLNRAVGEVDDSTSKVSKSFDRLKGQADLASAAIIGGAVVAAKTFTDAAAAQEQAMGGIEAVFKQNSDQVKAWADNAANAVGLSKTAYAELAAPIGAALKGAGMSLDDATQKTNQLITIGADLAATFGGSTSEAVGALGAALRGEFDPLERFGIALSADAVNAEMAAKGQDKLTGTAEALAKKQATLDLIMRGSADSTGQFAREADTAAGAAERQAAKWENVKAQLGEKLLPVVTELTGKLTGLTDWMSQNTDTVLVLGGALTAMAAAYVAVRAAVAAYQTIAAIATAVQWAWNVALSANPIGLVIIAIAAFVAALVLLWQNNEVVREKLTAAWEWIKNAFGVAVSWIGDQISKLLGWFGDMPGRIGGLLSGLVGIILWPYKTAFNAISDAWNNTVGRLSWTVPGWIPGIGGNTISAPKLPKFHSGGVVPGAPGQEVMAILKAGETVLPFGAMDAAREILARMRSGEDMRNDLSYEKFLAGNFTGSQAYVDFMQSGGGGMFWKGAFGTPDIARDNMGMDELMSKLEAYVGGDSRSSRGGTITFKGDTDSAFAAAFMKLVRQGKIQLQGTF